MGFEKKDKIFNIELNKIYCEEVETFLPLIPSGVAGLIIADPPFNKNKDYGEGYDDNKVLEDYYLFCETWIKEGFRILKDTGSFYIYINSRHLGRLQSIGSKYGIWQNTIIWHYTNPTPDLKRFPKTWGGFLFFSKTDNFFFSPYSESVPTLVSGRRRMTEGESRLYDVWWDISKLVPGYLAQKECICNSKGERIFWYQLPEKLIERIIRCSSETGELILDIFSHSGTSSAIACRLSRNYLAVERNKYFCEEIEKRVKR